MPGVVAMGLIGGPKSGGSTTSLAILFALQQRPEGRSDEAGRRKGPDAEESLRRQDKSGIGSTIEYAEEPLDPGDTNKRRQVLRSLLGLDAN